MKEIRDIKEIVSKVEGWLTDSEGEFLYNTAKQCSGRGVIVEIGSWKGKSTIWLGKGSKGGNNVKIYAIDPHTGSSEHKRRFGEVWTFEEFKKNIKNAEVDDVVVPIIKTSEDAEKGWKEPIEFLWIDGAHKYEMVKLDFELWCPYLIEGGIIAFHDTSYIGGPKLVVDKYIYRGNKFKNVCFLDGITFAQKVHKNSTKDKIKNRYVLLIRNIMIFAGKLNLPKPIRSIGKKILLYLGGT